MTATAMRIPVAVLGATGLVGQRMVARLARHPWFSVGTLAASVRSAGRPYAEACDWRLHPRLPEDVGERLVSHIDDCLPEAIVLSALDATAAAEVETQLARSGKLVVTNAAPHRLDPDVPLIVPEVNAGHLELLAHQRELRGWSGALIANPNCTTATLSLALGPLARAFDLVGVDAVTLQAVSGAGLPGVAALDLLGNVIPWIAGEEEKIAAESTRILGTLAEGAILDHSAEISAAVHRVPVADGHSIAVRIRTRQPVELPAIRRAWAEAPGARSAELLPSSPCRPIVVREEPDRPQPARDAGAEGGMATSVGRLRICPGGFRFNAVGHNLERGAAGGALLLAELAVARGWSAVEPAPGQLPV